MEVFFDSDVLNSDSFDEYPDMDFSDEPDFDVCGHENDDQSIIDSPYPDDYGLDVSEDELSALEEKAEGIDRSEHNGEISFGMKMCPTRHGCQGATDCDYTYGGYPG